MLKPHPPTWPATLLLVALLFVGCNSHRETPEQRAAFAKALFERATKEFHVPSAATTGADQKNLQDQAASLYSELLDKYPDQAAPAAQALRSLGNLRAAQTNLDLAVKCYLDVEKRYPAQDWEVLMSLKSAGDLLWDAGRQAEARPIYERLVARFDKPAAPQVVQTAVRGARTRLTLPIPDKAAEH
jgi:TolA-binding protein